MPTAADDWLAPAIRRIAARGGKLLAGELVLELLAHQERLLAGPLRYGLTIRELGDFEVAIAGGHAEIEATPDGHSRHAEFVLAGPAAAFAELAAGGAPGGRSGGEQLCLPGEPRERRAALALLAACRRPLTLADLAQARVWVWPGRLLVALAEAIGPLPSSVEAYAVSFVIDAALTLVVEARGDRPLRVRRIHALPPRAEPSPHATVRLSESAFTYLLADVQLPAGERIVVEGDVAALDRLLALTASAQGLQRRERRASSSRL